MVRYWIVLRSVPEPAGSLFYSAQVRSLPGNAGAMAAGVRPGRSRGWCARRARTILSTGCVQRLACDGLACRVQARLWDGGRTGQAEQADDSSSRRSGAAGNRTSSTGVPSMWSVVANGPLSSIPSADFPGDEGFSLPPARGERAGAAGHGDRTGG